MGGADGAVRSCDSDWLCSVGRREKWGSGLGARQGLSSLYQEQEMCSENGLSSQRAAESGSCRGQRRRGKSAS